MKHMLYRASDWLIDHTDEDYLQWLARFFLVLYAAAIASLALYLIITVSPHVPPLQCPTVLGGCEYWGP